MYDGSFCVVPNTGCPAGTIGTDVKDCNPNVLNGISVTKLPGTTGLNTTTKDDKTTTYSIDFSNSEWKGTCGKKKWANENNIDWDGVSNYNSCT
jgi:hypothetical protein